MCIRDRSISELISIPARVNLDFADVTAIMKNSGYAHMGVGIASGKDKAEVAANAAITSKLIETSMNEMCIRDRYGRTGKNKQD